MIETNAFLAMFAVLILTVSVLHMGVLLRFVRLKMRAIPDEYFAQLTPLVDRHQSMRVFATRYRLAHAAVALLGLALLGWLANYMQRPDWDKRWIVFPVMVYFILQWVPMMFTAMMGIKHMKVIKNFLLTAKRKATLKRRGLFDFVSPILVGVAVVAYVAFIAMAYYVSIAPTTRLWFIVAVTLNYALTIFSLYKMLYGKKSDPFETHAGRLYTIGIRARSSFYSCLLVVLFMSFTLVVIHNDLHRWMPFALAVFLTLATFSTFSVFTAPPRRLATGELDSSEALS